MGRGELPGLFGFYSSSAIWQPKTYGLDPQSAKFFLMSYARRKRYEEHLS
jgi:hypothetical protein